MNETEMEVLLRNAPCPAAPAGLKEQLLREIRVPSPSARPAAGLAAGMPWWRRWIPALAFGMAYLMCFVLLAVQTSQFLQLRRDNAALQVVAAEVAPLRQQNQALERARQQAQELDQLRRDNLERQRLVAEIAERKAETADLPQVRAENQRLLAEQAELRRRLPAAASGEVDPFAKARAQAQRIQCINHLKQIALAARLWSSDNAPVGSKDMEVMPKDFLCMSNELGSTKILVCPADARCKPAANFAEFTPANVSYELVSPGVSDRDPEVVLFHCPIHNSAALVDGSVQWLSTNRVVGDVDGKKKIINPHSPAGRPAR